MLLSLMSRRVEALLAQVMLGVGEMKGRGRTSVSVSEAVRDVPRCCGMFRVCEVWHSCCICENEA